MLIIIFYPEPFHLHRNNVSEQHAEFKLTVLKPVLPLEGLRFDFPMVHPVLDNVSVQWVIDRGRRNTTYVFKILTLFYEFVINFISLFNPSQTRLKLGIFTVLKQRNDEMSKKVPRKLLCICSL